MTHSDVSRLQQREKVQTPRARARSAPPTERKPDTSHLPASPLGNDSRLTGRRPAGDLGIDFRAFINGAVLWACGRKGRV